MVPGRSTEYRKGQTTHPSKKKQTETKASRSRFPGMGQKGDCQSEGAPEKETTNSWGGESTVRKGGSGRTFQGRSPAEKETPRLQSAGQGKEGVPEKVLIPALIGENLLSRG